METNTIEKLLKKNHPILVDFFADWCGPCRAMFPILEEVSSNVGPAIEILSLNVEEVPELVKQFDIQDLPAFILIKNGVECWRRTGMISAFHLEQKIKEVVLSGC